MKPRRLGRGSWWASAYLLPDCLVNAVFDRIALAPQGGYVVRSA